MLRVLIVTPKDEEQPPVQDELHGEKCVLAVITNTVIFAKLFLEHQRDCTQLFAVQMTPPSCRRIRGLRVLATGEYHLAGKGSERRATGCRS